jgi:eukaryotic-like serine/threonine-protein kinase
MQPVTTPRVFSGRYELTHMVARGGMAQVYRAHDRLLDRPVALKVLFPELSVDRAFVERFRREAQAAANLSHPNIVPVFDWGEDGGTYYIVMEYVDGQPLSQALRTGGPMPAQRVAMIGARVADALAYAHRHGVVHRDVKPGNVLITNDEQVKVTDFGIARAVNTEESLTQTGAVMGTATYFSPEQAEGVGVDPRSDIYSLGVVMFEMVAGRPPFLGESPVAVASKHVRERPPLLRDLNPTVPPALEAIIAKAMAKSADLRYQTATELRADLQRFVAGRPVGATSDPAATTMLAGAGAAAATGVVDPVTATQAVPSAGPPPGQENAHLGRWLVLLLALLVVLGVIIYFVLHSLGYIGGASTFAMPTVRGQPVATATSTLTAKGLVPSETTRPSTSVAKTDVISTAPGSGAKVSKGTHVTVVVSSGQVAKVTVPTLKTQNVATAQSTLHREGLNYSTSTQASTKPTGTVLSQSPAAGKQVKKGTTVNLVVSTQTTVVVPSVLGDSQTAAGSQLGAAGLTAGKTSTGCSTKYGTGEVMNQTPAPNAKVKPQTAVDLQISSGPCPVSVPKVTGTTETAARSKLAGAGLTAVPQTTVACAPTTNGKVLSQTPANGTSVSKGSNVTITVCKSATTTTTTGKTKSHTTGTPVHAGPTSRGGTAATERRHRRAA